MALDKYTQARESGEFGAWVLQLNPARFNPGAFRFGQRTTFRVSRGATKRAYGMSPGDRVFLYVTQGVSEPAHFRAVGYVTDEVTEGFVPSEDYKVDPHEVADDFTGYFIFEELERRQQQLGSKPALRTFPEMQKFELFASTRRDNPFLTTAETDFLIRRLGIDCRPLPELLAESDQRESSKNEDDHKTGPSQAANESYSVGEAIEEIVHKTLFNSDPESRKKTEQLAIAKVTAHYERQKLRVQSVESQHLGWDLEVFAGEKLKYRVEVKGRATHNKQIILTINEIQALLHQDDWVLVLVSGTSLGVDDSTLHIYSATQVLDALNNPERSAPLAYRLSFDEENLKVDPT